jgi:competence protein ComEC
MNSPLGITDINDATLILRLDHGNQSILFVADTNRRLGNYLVEHGERLRATMMSAPHHGVESAAPNEFLDLVKPKAVLVSTSQVPWMSSRGKRMRKYFNDRGIDTYVNGVHGHVTVRLFEDRYEVNTERE